MINSLPATFIVLDEHCYPGRAGRSLRGAVEVHLPYARALTAVSVVLQQHIYAPAAGGSVMERFDTEPILCHHVGASPAASTLHQIRFEFLLPADLVSTAEGVWLQHELSVSTQVDGGKLLVESIQLPIAAQDLETLGELLPTEPYRTAATTGLGCLSRRG